jgi:CBS domain-containing membrane protein
MSTLATIRQWMRGAFPGKGGWSIPHPRQAQGAAIARRLEELTLAWQEQASRDEWSRLRCGKVMRSSLVTMPDTSIGAALELLQRNGTSAAPVVDGEQQLLGLVTVDQLTIVPDHLASTTRAEPQRVGDVMITDIESVGDTDCLATAFQMLMVAQCACLPVVDWRGHVVGMLVESDILDLPGRNERDLASG